MATVVSLTASKIEELLAGYEGVELSQDEINTLVIQLSTLVEGVGVRVDDFENNVLPQMQADFEAGSVLISNLNDNLLPQLQNDMDAAKLDLQNLTEVDLPSLRDDMDNTVINLRERPSVYVQAEMPTNPDEEGRDLVVGDTWFDEDNNNAQLFWNGVEWTSLQIDVSDLIVTVKQLVTYDHMLFDGPGAVAVTKGSGIS